MVKANALKTDGATTSKAYALYNAGNLTIGENSEISAGDATNNVNLSAKTSADTLDVMLANNSVTTLQGTAGIGGVGTVNVTLGENAELNFEGATAISNTKAANLTVGAGSVVTFGATAFEASSKTNLTLNGEADKNTKLVFNGTAGTVETLSGSNAEIFLAGADAAAVKARFEVKAPFAGRTLQIKEADIDNSHIVLAAKSTSELSPSDPNFTGKIIDSDRIIIDADAVSATELKKNTIHVMVDQYITEKSDKVAILAVTEKNSKLIFNNLESDDTEVNATVYSGFTNGEIAIKRESDGTNTYYTSNLMTTNISVNTDFVAPTTAALSTGVSLFSANLNSLSKRMGELRNNPYSHGVWTRVFGGEQTTNFGAKQSTVYSTIQAGYDYKLDLGDAANYIGVAVSYTKGMGGQVNPTLSVSQAPLNIPVAGLSSSNTDGVEVAVYNSYVAESGLYSDSILKFGCFMSDLTMPLINDLYSTSNFCSSSK